MAGEIRIIVKCPTCSESLMQPDKPIDNLDAINFLAKIGDKIGNVYLSQIYGSYNKIFENVEDKENAIVECSCPRCHAPFPVFHQCEICSAPVIGLSLEMGGTIKVCSRNGCKRHSLEFENTDDAFRLFQGGDETGLF